MKLNVLGTEELGRQSIGNTEGAGEKIFNVLNQTEIAQSGGHAGDGACD